MPRIKIEDLPVLEDLETKESQGIFGGIAGFFIKIDSVDGEESKLSDYDSKYQYYDSVDGESQEKDYDGWSDILSFPTR